MRKTRTVFSQVGCLILLLTGKLHAVCNQAWVGDNSQFVTVIDTNTQMQISAFEVGGEEVASGIVFTPDGSQVFLTDTANGIFAIDASTHTSTQISSQFGATDITMDPNGQSAYVAMEALASIFQVNTTTHVVTLLNSTPYSVPLEGIAITPDGSKLYTVGGSTVLVVDASNGNILQTISIPSAMNLFKVAITPDGSLAYVTDSGSLGGGGNVFQVNTSNFAVAAVSAGVFLPFSRAWDVAINPNGQFAYVSDLLNQSIDVIDIASNTVINELFGPSILFPTGVAVSPDGNFVYVANFGLVVNSVSTIDTSTFVIHPVTNSTAAQPFVIAFSPPCPPNEIKGRIAKNKDFWQTNLFSELCWEAPATGTPVHYLIYRNGKQVAVIPGTQTFFKDNYLKPNKNYAYSIFAVTDSNVKFLIGSVTLNTR